MIKPYYSHNNFTLYKGDCRKLLPRLPKLSIDMIFADPPYFLSNGTFTCHAGKRTSVKKGSWDLGKDLLQNINFHFDWIKKCRQVLKHNGTIWISGTYHSIYQCLLALNLLKYCILNDIIWFKPNAPPNLSCRMFTASHETLIWAKKEKDSKYTFNYNLIKNKIYKNDPIKKEKKQMRSVWCISSSIPSEKKHGKHPTQKPIELLNRIILASTKENDTILDVFTGSSTTGIVAIQNNRKYLGIDTNTDYLNLSIKRYEHIILNKNANNY
jgi:site-specific DNA-methyltransferase (adenine-specific)